MKGKRGKQKRNRKIIAVLVVLALALLLNAAWKEEETSAAKGEGYADFSAALWFLSDKSDQVTLEITNNGDSDFVVADQAHYIDQEGSAGSWDCRQKSAQFIKPGKSKRITFDVEKSVTHGDNSILSFYFQYKGRWYIGKTGIKNGTEYYAQHN